MFDPARPFVLLDDAASGTARLFSGMAEALDVHAADGVAPAIARLAELGPWAGFIGFEAGHALEPRLARLGVQPPTGQPLLWMGRFANEAPVDAAALLQPWAGAPTSIGALAPSITQDQHADAVARLHALIASGDIYQANLTFPAHVAVSGHPLSLYARLRAGSAAPYGAVVFTGSQWHLSFSPELFFRLEGRRLTARPMKGTAPRGRFVAEDAARAAALAADPKNRAENLMITDLIRNDLSRVADHVAVPSLFAVERYPTVLQMTSTVTATARPGITAADVLMALFPCGSVTGAPKIRSLEVLAEVEPAPRGVYCGAIGAISASGDALFNVAIRTLSLDGSKARLGLGSGIVADSVAADEWAECLAKAAFLHRSGPPDLIETIRVVAGTLPNLDGHMARLAASAAHLGHRLDQAAVRAACVAAAAGQAGRLRLVLAPTGAWAIQCSPAPPPRPSPLRVKIVPLPVAPDDWRLCHKTSDRSFYDDARRAAGADEVIFVRPDGQLTEGSFTSLFVAPNGRLLTPPAALGLLPGVLRARLLADGTAVEAPLTAADLAGGFWLGNALRGLMPARLG